MHNPFDIWAPNDRGPIENLAFSAYAYNQQQIEAFINELSASTAPDDEWEQWRIACKVGIKLDRLTDAEKTYIEEEVTKRQNDF